MKTTATTMVSLLLVGAMGCTDKPGTDPDVGPDATETGSPLDSSTAETDAATDVPPETSESDTATPDADAGPTEPVVTGQFVSGAIVTTIGPQTIRGVFHWHSATNTTSGTSTVTGQFKTKP